MVLLIAILLHVCTPPYKIIICTQAILCYIHAEIFSNVFSIKSLNHSIMTIVDYIFRVKQGIWSVSPMLKLFYLLFIDAIV